jgi:electron transfer flavoprotein beta subunit
VLAAAIKQESPDVVICATESYDGSTGMVPPMLAELLGMPQLTFAKHLEVDGGKVTVHRQTEDGHQVVEAQTPALVTVTAGVVEPRYPSFKGIMAAKGKPVEQLKVTDLGLSPDEVGSAGARQEVIDVAAAEERKAGEIVVDEGDAHERIVAFLDQLKVL